MYTQGGTEIMKLFHIQDSDRPMYVIGDNWQGALSKWKNLVADENNMQPTEVEEPLGIALISLDDELIT